MSRRGGVSPLPGVMEGQLKEGRKGGKQAQGNGERDLDLTRRTVGLPRAGGGEAHALKTNLG